MQAPPTDAPTEVSVEDERVQELLARLVCVDFDRIFATRKEPLAVPEYRVMSLHQLKKVS